jgi:glycosyltransferase involved in cell wall biosynthesis
VAYFGQYIPLHGVPCILAAAARLRDRPIDFVLAGQGQELGAARDLAVRLRLENVEFQPSWRTPADLARDVLGKADVCLGAFADSAKGQVVVPFKVYAALAAGRAVITADTPAAREILGPSGCVRLVPMNDPEALAAAIGELADQPAWREELARAGRATYDRRFAPAQLGGALVAALEAAEAELRAPSRLPLGVPA